MQTNKYILNKLSFEQIHGISWDTIKFTQKLITTEMNSSSDNPLILIDSEDVVSGGNAHGEYPAKVLDCWRIN